MEDEMERDLEKLQGAWQIVSLEIDGQKLGGMEAGMEVHGSRFTTSGMGADYSGTLGVDPKARPRSFDLKFETGPEAGNTSLGIYELDGDSWKICMTTRGSERPREFAAPVGTGIALEILQRAGAGEAVESQAAEALTVPAGDGAEELTGEWKATTLVRDGDALPAAMLSHGKRTATAHEVTIKFGPQVILKASYSVDRSKSPMTMDYELADGNRQAGIWKLESGALTTCFGTPGSARPAEFASTKGSGLTLAVWTPANQ
jgi:uncharacterized protein (TIGR03067 family)